MQTQFSLLDLLLEFFGKYIEADDVLKVAEVGQFEEHFDCVLAAEAGGNGRVFKAIGEVVHAKSEVQGYQCETEEATGHVSQHPLIPVLGEDSHQLHPPFLP